MNEVDLLALGEALARTTETLRPDGCLPFCDYLERVVQDEAQRAAIFQSGGAYAVSLDGRPVEGPASTVPVTRDSRIVLYRRQGPALDVLTRGVVRRICLN